MAATKTNKYGTGDGWFQIDIGTTVQTNPHTTLPIVRVKVNKAAYDALAAAGKSDIDAVTIGDCITEAFD